MCGIIGCVANRNAAAFIIDGLKKLEYRGYDSAGIAIVNPTHDTSGASDTQIRVVKKKGRLSILASEVERLAPAGSTAIGHTRWATHGEPSDANSHPHLSQDGKIAVVHNGIIENYRELRAFLIQNGVKFASETDSEVIAALARYYYDGDLFLAVTRVLPMLRGSYALGFICADEPDTLIAVRKDNPLIAASACGARMIASDIPAVLAQTNRIYTLSDLEIAVLNRRGIQFFTPDGKKINKKPEKINWNCESAEKCGYEHFMLKEIYEQPRVIRDTAASLISQSGQNRAVVSTVNITDYNRIVLVGCCSAFNAGVVGKYVFEKLLRLPVETEFASEFRYKEPLVDAKTLAIFISQSGETADTIAALREAKARGAATLAVVNVVGSTLAKEADTTVFTLAGPEIAVATTKALSAQLVVLYALAAEFAKKLGKNDSTEQARLLAEITALPQKVEKILAQAEKIRAKAEEFCDAKSTFFIGRNIDYAIALEGSLKLKEISYIHSEAYAGGELKHGTISLIEPGTPVVAVCGCRRLLAKTLSNVQQTEARGACAVLIAAKHHADAENEVNAETDTDIATGSRTVLEIPQSDELFSPSLSVIVLQLLSYYTAKAKGCDIDKPRNLAKSVTVE